MNIKVDFLDSNPELVDSIKRIVANRKRAIVITIGNWKGGVSKTASTVQLANVLSMMGFKVAVADQDAQGNTTNSLILTKKAIDNSYFDYEETLMRGIQKGDLTRLPVEIKDNLYLLPSTSDFFSFTNFLDVKFGVVLEGTPEYLTLEEKKISYLPSLLEPLLSDFDFLLIDTPPGDSYATKSAIYLSDYVMVALQTQSDSLENAVDFVQRFIPKIYQFNENLDIIGVLASMLNAPGSPLDDNGELPRERLAVIKEQKKKWTLDLEVYEDALNQFGDEEVFKTIIPYMRRITTVPRRGARLEDRWDKEILITYHKLALEILERINERIGE
ncbi:ParA family protein [Carnobacterium maltaromaticum]|uniref:ParA family protein n=1 Tax=Carnobacterium maltaromaticum TaxID=2751 RepID=UPI0012F99661|nr:ParA family protein [Carnobacterium maltaromaticum]CAD5903214.1 conserved hypothetical protein [Carnobacterium maltaromaticum]